MVWTVDLAFLLLTVCMGHAFNQRLLPIEMSPKALKHLDAFATINGEALDVKYVSYL